MMAAPFPIIYEDNHLLVINKPAGMLTQQTEAEQWSATEFCKKYLKEKYSKPGEVFLHAIHRLDRCASGVVVFARTSKALERVNSAMREHRTIKTYHAWVSGAIVPASGTLEHYLIHGDHRADVSTSNNAKAKRCLLDYTSLQTQGNLTLLAITLHTGRYHQIRAQLAACGHPILGDDKYGSTLPYEKKSGEKKIALHHIDLILPHPTTGELLHLHASWQ